MVMTGTSPRSTKSAPTHGGMDKRVDLVVAVAFLAFGMWLFWSSTQIPQGSVDDAIGSGGVARVLALLIIALSGSLVVRRLVTWGRERGVKVPDEGTADDPVAPASTARGFAVFASLVAYVAGTQFLGYLIATPLFLILALRLMEVRAPLRLVGIAVGYTVGSFVLFVGVFGVLLPLGVLERWDYYLWFRL